MKKKSPLVLISDAIIESRIKDPICMPLKDYGLVLEWVNQNWINKHLEVRILGMEILDNKYFYTLSKAPGSDGYEKREKIKAGDKELIDKLFQWLRFEIDKI